MSTYFGLTQGTALMMSNFGSDWMKEKVLPRLMDGSDQGTMCLTEAQAGSDLVAVATIAKRMDVNDHIRWLEWVKQSDLASFYSDHDVFVFPSLHDSGGLVVIEAMANYLPVICLDLGGPATSVNNHCGIVVETIGKNPGDVVDGLYRAMKEIVLDTEKRERLSRGAYERAKEFTWPSLTSSVIDPAII